MVRRNEEIVSQVLSMNEAQLDRFLKTIGPDALEYLDIILEKSEKEISRLKRYAKYVESTE